MEHRIRKIRRYRRGHGVYTTGQALEGLIYELKPIFYLMFVIALLTSSYMAVHWIKVSTLGVLLFTLAIIYGRLIYRGYLGDDR